MDKIANILKSKTFKITVIVIVAIILIAVISLVIFSYIKNARPENANLVINNNNVTARLKKQVLVENEVIYIAKEDIQNFFDKYIEKDEKTGKIITTYGKKIAAMELNNKTIEVNGSDKNIYAAAKEENGTIYLPISELEDVYNVECQYFKDTNIVTLDSLDKEQIKAYTAKNVTVRNRAGLISYRS